MPTTCARSTPPPTARCTRRSGPAAAASWRPPTGCCPAAEHPSGSGSGGALVRRGGLRVLRTGPLRVVRALVGLAEDLLGLVERRVAAGCLLLGEEVCAAGDPVFLGGVLGLVGHGGGVPERGSAMQAPARARE